MHATASFLAWLVAQPTDPVISLSSAFGRIPSLLTDFEFLVNCAVPGAFGLLRSIELTTWAEADDNGLAHKKWFDAWGTSLGNFIRAIKLHDALCAAIALSQTTPVNDGHLATISIGLLCFIQAVICFPVISHGVDFSDMLPPRARVPAARFRFQEIRRFQ